MHRVSLATDTLVYSQGEEPGFCYLILAGEVAMERRGVIVRASSGAIIGFSALVPRAYGATARTAKETSLLAFTRKELRDLIRADPDRAMLIIDGIIDMVDGINAAREQPAG